MNYALAERGIRGTGSALAKSFLGWGRASTPVPGAVAVSSRRGGGHVAIVSRVESGQVYVWNPSPRGRGWQEVAYRHRAISYRVPG
ncbi:CHAP domain-containing protein [Tardiphaga sp.]|uniref:CHAP domain-containing protein n=1 Tax=Tardiphaga sp. TaxID=1926292 RepID=UPI00262EB072|nr:CHAP domain-containing protein [Tardiphaga sp.]